MGNKSGKFNVPATVVTKNEETVVKESINRVDETQNDIIVEVKIKAEENATEEVNKTEETESSTIAKKSGFLSWIKKLSIRRDKKPKTLKENDVKENATTEPIVNEVIEKNDVDAKVTESEVGATEGEVKIDQVEVKADQLEMKTDEIEVNVDEGEMKTKEVNVETTEFELNVSEDDIKLSEESTDIHVSAVEEIKSNMVEEPKENGDVTEVKDTNDVSMNGNGELEKEAHTVNMNGESLVSAGDKMVNESLISAVEEQ